MVRALADGVHQQVAVDLVAPAELVVEVQRRPCTRKRERKRVKRMRDEAKEALEGDQNLRTTTYLCSFCF